MADVKQSNPNAFRELENQLRQLDKYEARIGWFPAAKYEDGTPVAYVAAIQEEGYGPIPPRLGAAQLCKKLNEHWKIVASAASKRVVDGEISGRKGMGLVAIEIRGDLVNHISNVQLPPLKELTLAVRKKREQGVKITGALVGELARRLNDGKKVSLSANTKPLKDSGYLLKTLSYAIVEAGR